ncbi:hypothetical protein BO443_170086 [Burkholderia orbicola]
MRVERLRARRGASGRARRVGRDAAARMRRAGRADRTGNAGPPSAGGMRTGRARAPIGLSVPLRFGLGHPRGMKAGAPATSRHMSVPLRSRCGSAARCAANVQPAA